MKFVVYRDIHVRPLYIRSEVWQMRLGCGKYLPHLAYSVPKN